MNEEQVRKIVAEELMTLLGSQRYIFRKHIQLFDGINIQAGKTTGTIIGTETTQKIGFYGETPVVQAGAISAPTGGATIDAEARTAINSIRVALANIGIIA